ncbi:hypothetical protein ES705_33693 [subsurface metagenome]
MSIMIFNNFISQEEQEILYKYVEENDFKLEDALILTDNKTEMFKIFLRPFGSDLKSRLYKKMEELRKSG